MSERVANRMGGGAEDGRVLQGYLSPDEAGQSGMPLTRGDVMALNARNADEMEAASRVRRMEELRRSDEVFGRDVEGVRGRQQDWATDRVKAELGIEGAANITDDVLGDTLNQLGRQFDEFAEAVGNVEVPPSVFDQIEEVAKLSGSDRIEVQVRGISKRIERNVEQNGGVLTGEDWQQIRREINKHIEAGARAGDYGRVQAAGDVMELMTEQMESAASQEMKQMIRTARKRYGLARTLASRAGVRNPEGQINASSLYNAMRSPGAIRRVTDDSLLRQLETARYLTAKVAPSSGTAERLLANPGRAILSPLQTVLSR
jgi:hypothetical protein